MLHSATARFIRTGLNPSSGEQATTPAVPESPAAGDPVAIVGMGCRYPGGVDTPIMSSFNVPEGGDAKLLNRIMSRMGFSTPEQIASAIAFIGSDESAYTTGAILSVDGGLTA